MMSLFVKDAAAKLVPQCTSPLTGLACVGRVYIDHAVFAIGDSRVRAVETFGISPADLQCRLPAPIT